MQKRAFTLIELAIVLTIIGLLIGGSFKVMKMMREKAKTAEAKELVLGAKNAVLGYALENVDLPTYSEFNASLSLSKDPSHPMFYAVDVNLSNDDDICAYDSIGLKVNNLGSVINDVAFVVAHEGANYNLQTGVSGDTVTIYASSTRADDNTTYMNNANHEFDDIVAWVTLKQLQDEVGCIDKAFRFVTDKLPNAKVLIPYPSTSGTAKLEVENNIDFVTMSCDFNTSYGINFNTTTFEFYGTPTEADTIMIECNATVTDSQQFASKEFVITIDPNYDREKEQSCTLNTECSGGYCAGGVCTTGGFGEICDNQKTPDIFDLENSDCKSAICYDADGNGTGVCSGDIGYICNDAPQCLSGFCAGGVCTTGIIGADCDNNASDCQSGFCGTNQCTTGNLYQVCNSDGDCKSGICYDHDADGDLECSGAIGDKCGGDEDCLTNHCDGTECAIMPSSDSNGTSGGCTPGAGAFNSFCDEDSDCASCNCNESAEKCK